MKLPPPPLAEQAHSLQLQQLIKHKMQSQGMMSFHDFMQMALYEPVLGYYSAGARKIGKGGDFITAPEITPFFGYTLAKTLLPAIDQLTQHQWLELGAGTGKLAASILTYLAEQRKIPAHYFILEVSADLKQRQQEYLTQALPRELASRIEWLERLPQEFTGIIVANEVLDAFPVRRFTVTEHGFDEGFVCWRDNCFRWRFAPSSSERLVKTVPALIERYHLPQGYTSEVNLQQVALMKSLAQLLQQGVIVFIDYGYAQREYYYSERYQGTLRCYYQQLVHDDPFWWPGLQDITAHVDFTALALSAIENNLTLLNYASQSNWLMHAGILELAQQQAKKQTISTSEEYQWQQAIRRLISPQEMGELFKIMLLGTKDFKAISWPMVNESMRLG